MRDQNELKLVMIASNVFFKVLIAASNSDKHQVIFERTVAPVTSN